LVERAGVLTQGPGLLDDFGNRDGRLGPRRHPPQARSAGLRPWPRLRPGQPQSQDKALGVSCVVFLEEPAARPETGRGRPPKPALEPTEHPAPGYASSPRLQGRVAGVLLDIPRPSCTCSRSGVSID